MPSYAGPHVSSRLDPAAIVRLVVLAAFAFALIVLDSRGGWLSQWRSQANALMQPMWALVGMPSHMADGLTERLSSHGQLLEDNRRLREQLLVANTRLVRLRAAAEDNARLRERLGAAERSGLDVQLVPLLDVDLDPVRQRLVLGAGRRQGVRVGQAVIDAGGLLGQVIEVTALQSVVLLLTDPDHAVPVTVARNGVRLIAYGRGTRLELRDIPLSADVQVGDAIVTSGLGGRFPAGFPVGKVVGLEPDDSHAFLVGELTPAAHLDRGGEVMLLRSEVSAPVMVSPDDQAARSVPDTNSAPALGAASAPPVTAPAAPDAAVGVVGSPALRPLRRKVAEDGDVLPATPVSADPAVAADGGQP